MLPPGCADETVTITLDAYLPSNTQKHSLLSAVFDITTNVETFKKPLTVHIPHCANIKSEEDKDRMYFLVMYENSHEFKKGCFEIGKSFGSVKLNKFGMVVILDGLLSAYLDPLSLFISSGVAQSQAVIDPNLKEKHRSGANVKIKKKYLDLLILPKSHEENWFGKYCIIQDISTYWQVTKVIIANTYGYICVASYVCISTTLNDKIKTLKTISLDRNCRRVHIQDS